MTRARARRRRRLPWLLAVLVAFACLPSCTILMWQEEGGWWHVSREEYESIASATVAANRTMYLRIVRSHADPLTWSVSLHEVHGDHPRTWIDPPLTADRPTPESAHVAIVSKENGEDLLDGGKFAWDFEGADYLVFLDGSRENVDVVIIDSRSPRKAIRCALPDPAIAWLTPNAIGHVVLTPVTVTLDVVCVPFYVLFGVLMATGVVDAHC